MSFFVLLASPPGSMEPENKKTRNFVHEISRLLVLVCHHKSLVRPSDNHPLISCIMQSSTSLSTTRNTREADPIYKTTCILPCQPNPWRAR